MASPAPDLASPSKRRRTQAQPFGATLESAAAASGSQPSTPSARRGTADAAGDGASPPGTSSQRGAAMSHLPPAARGQFQSALGPRTKGRPSRARLVAEAAERRAWRAQENERRKARGEEPEGDTPEPDPNATRPRKSGGGAKRKRSAVDDDDDGDDDDEASASDGYSPAARTTPSGRPRRAAAVAAQDSFAAVEDDESSESESDADGAPTSRAAVRAPAARMAQVAAPIAPAVAPAMPVHAQAVAATGTPIAATSALVPEGPPVPVLNTEPFEDVDATCAPGPKGWMAEPPDAATRWLVLGRIVKALRQERDRQGHNLAMRAGLLNLPEPDTPEGARLFARMPKPTSLTAIGARVEAKEYASAHDFELDVLQMFESFRQYHEPGMPPYGATLHLQRYFQSMTAGEPKASNARLRSYASVVRAPNGALPQAPQESGQLPLLEYKGRIVRVGDWVHLASSSDPRRPHVGCVFKLTTGPTGPRIFVNWYARPSETEHSHTRTFAQNEVFKTAVFVSHAASDLIDHCAVLFDRKYLRGRPRVSEDGTGWKSTERVYVCQDRWKTELKIFIKIKNWAQAMPDSMKGVDSLVYFPETDPWGPRQLSPFLRNFGFTGPGKLTDGLPPPGLRILDDFRPGATPARAARVVQQAAPATPMPQPLPPPPQRALPPPTSEEGVRLRIASLLEQLRSGYGPYAADSAFNVLGGVAGRAINVLELAVAIGAHGSFALGLLSDLQAAFAYVRTSGFDRMLPPDAPPRASAPRAAPYPIPSAWDVLTAYHSDAYTEVLPPATQALFDLDEAGRVRWYLGAPLDGPTQHAVHRSGVLAEPRPAPSLEYLAFRAQRRADGTGPVARRQDVPKLPPSHAKPALSAVPAASLDIDRAFSASLDRSAEHLSHFLSVEPAAAPL